MTRAAERLAIAQPPLSQQIRSFERELGFALFQRTPKGVSLTPAGVSLLLNARRIVTEIDAAVREATDVHRGISGRLVVAFMNTAVYSLMPSLLAAYRAARPKVVIDVREMTIVDQFDAIVGGHVDVGILRPPVDDSRLAMLPLMRERFVIALPLRHPLNARRVVTLADLGRYPLIAFPRGHIVGFRERIDACMRAAGVTPQIAQEAIQIHTICGLVSSGIGWALVPESARVLALPGVRWKRLTNTDLFVETAIAWRADKEDARVADFVTIVRSAARNREQ